MERMSEVGFEGREVDCYITPTDGKSCLGSISLICKYRRLKNHRYPK